MIPRTFALLALFPLLIGVTGKAPKGSPDASDASRGEERRQRLVAEGPRAGLAGPTSSFLGRARDWIAGSEYEARSNGAGLQAPNRAHNLRTYFHESGVRVHDRTAADGPALVELRLVGFGREEALASVGAGEVVSLGSRVEIRRPGLTEWFVNSPEGLEQGFSIAERPQGDGPLVVELAIRGARARSTGAGAQLRTQTGRTLRYGKLKVLDAEGRSLVARLEVPGPERIRLVADDTGASFPVVIDPLLSSVIDARLEADLADAEFGTSVAGAGDVNGDGVADVIVGAPEYDAGDPGEGAAFIFLGGQNFGDGSPLSADTLLYGDQADANLGQSVAGAGDVNNDGYDDVIVGVPLFDVWGPDIGAAFVYHGSATGVADVTTNPFFNASSYLLGTATGVPGTCGPSNSCFGLSVAGAGDVNNDSYDDVIVGAREWDNGNADEGGAFIFHGSATGIVSAEIDQADTKLESNQTAAYLGASVAGAGDVNNDGYDDVIVGAPFYDSGQTWEGSAFVFLGGASGVADANPNTAHEEIESNLAFASCGAAVAGAGDVNGDSYDDVIVGCSGYSAGESSEGIALLFAGSAGGIAGSCTGTCGPTEALAQLEGDQGSAFFGSSVASLGDVNGDNFPDVIVGAPFYDSGESNEGAAFVFLGTASGVPRVCVLGSPPRCSAADAIRLEAEQAGADFGRSVAGVGDVNDDRCDDALVGAPDFAAGELQEGAAFVYFGESEAVANERPPSQCGDGDLDCGEECDDGNHKNGDGCSRSCEIGPGVPVTLVGPEPVDPVFDWAEDKCETDDFPDLPARAFRDVDGQVNLIAAHWTNYRLVGPSLDEVESLCVNETGPPPVLSSTKDTTYENFKYHEWISAPYTLDGQTVYALVHNEWYAKLVDPTCSPDPTKGWVSAVTQVVSTDKGASYTTPTDYKVLTPPEELDWDTGNPAFTCSETNPTKYGAFSPSSIVHNPEDGYYYAMFETVADPDHDGDLDILDLGICVMRTPDPADATAWEIWTGAGWDPSERAVCAKLDGLRGTLKRSLTFNSYMNAYVVTGKSGWPAEGVYYSTSSDFIEWSTPVLITLGNGNAIEYPALLDPEDSSLNFEVTGQDPYLYYRRYTVPQSPHRDLMRRQIHFTADSIPAPQGRTCPHPPCCGDGVLDPGEECDDTNQRDGDCCSSTCTVETGPGAPPCCSPSGTCRTGEACGGGGCGGGGSSYCRVQGRSCECVVNTKGGSCPVASGSWVFTSSTGTLNVGCAPASTNLNMTILLDVRGVGGDECVHEVIVPSGGLSSPAVCVEGAFTTRIRQTACGIGRFDSDGGADYTVTQTGDTSAPDFCVNHASCSPGADGAAAVGFTLGDGSPDSCTSTLAANLLLSIPAEVETWQSPDWATTCPDCDGKFQPYPHCGCGTSQPGAECSPAGGTDPACGGDGECKAGDVLESAFALNLDLTTDAATAKFEDAAFGGNPPDGCFQAGSGCAGPVTAGGPSNPCLDQISDTITLHAAAPIGLAGSGWPYGDALWSAVLSGTLDPAPLSSEFSCTSWAVDFDGGSVDRCMIEP